MKKQKNVYGILIILLFTFGMIGCGQKMMALNLGQSRIETTDKSIALLSVTMTNEYKPSRQPRVGAVNIGSESEKATPKNVHLTKGAYVKQTGNQNAEYFLSFELSPGKNVLKRIWGEYKVPLLVSAICIAKNLNLETTLRPGAVVYLGHVTATIRERKNDDEEPAGPLFPLIDQTIAGFHGGTFDIVVEDRYEEDMEIFLSQYPGLKNVKIEKSILPQRVKPGYAVLN